MLTLQHSPDATKARMKHFLAPSCTNPVPWTSEFLHWSHAQKQALDTLTLELHHEDGVCTLVEDFRDSTQTVLIMAHLIPDCKV